MVETSQTLLSKLYEGSYNKEDHLLKIKCTLAYLRPEFIELTW